MRLSSNNISPTYFVSYFIVMFTNNIKSLEEETAGLRAKNIRRFPLQTKTPTTCQLIKISAVQGHKLTESLKNKS